MENSYKVRDKKQIAYLINNGVELHVQNSPLLRIQYLINCLRDLDYHVSLMALDKREVILTDGWDMKNFARQKYCAGWLFNMIESGLRRIQGELKIPYLGLFDGIRFYEACLLNLSEQDILHERYQLFEWGALLAGKKMRIPVVLDVEADPFRELEFLGTPLKGFKKWFAQAIFRYALNNAEAITSVSEVLKDHLVKKWGVKSGKIFILSNGVDTALFSPNAPSDDLRTKLGVSQELIITFIGGFYPWHDIHLLIDAFQTVVTRFPNSRLLLVGDGQLMPTVVEKLAQCNLGPYTILAGCIDHDQIPNYLNISDVCVAPYPKLSTEIWFSPMKLYEYMSSGKAIVATRSGQVSEVIQHNQNGMLVDAGDPHQLADTISDLLKDKAKRDCLGKNARMDAVSHYSWNAFGDRLSSFYQKLV